MFDDVYLTFLKKAAARAEWVGSVCTGAFILAAARLLDNATATTHWAVIDSLKRLHVSMGIEVPEGYKRYVIDDIRKRFSGGGISSSMDLALELVLQLGSRQTAELSQLTNQYAPDPPVSAGDPSQASREVVAKARRASHKFIKGIDGAVTELLKR